MAEFYPPPRPPPPSPWMPLFFIALMWALPMFLRFEPVVMQAMNQLSILVSLTVPVVLIYLLQWASAPGNGGHLQYPNSRYGNYRGASSPSFSDPQSFGWGLVLVLVVFLLVTTTGGRIPG